MTIEQLIVELTIKDNQLNEKLQTVSKKLDQMEQGFGAVGAAGDKSAADISRRWAAVETRLNSTGQALATASGVMAVGFGLVAREAMGAETANLNLTKSVTGAQKSFGDNIGTLDGWQSTIKTLQNQMKIFTTSELRNAVSLTIDSTKRYGLNEEQMQRLITATANLGAGKEDLTQSLMRTTAAIRGEAEASEFLGLTLNENYVMSQLASLGITKLWKDMDDAEKAAARFELMMRQSADAEGKVAEFAQTSQGKLQAFRAELQDTAAAWGDAFLPVLTQVTESGTASVRVLADIREAAPGLTDTILKIGLFETALAATGGAALLLAGNLGKTILALKEFATASQLARLASFGLYGGIIGGVIIGIIAIAEEWQKAKIAKEDYFINTVDSERAARQREVYVARSEFGAQRLGDEGRRLAGIEALDRIEARDNENRVNLTGSQRSRAERLKAELLAIQDVKFGYLQLQDALAGVDQLFMDVTAREKSEEKPVTPPKPPITPVGGGGASEKATQDEIIEFRRKTNQISTTDYYQYWTQRLTETKRGSKEELQIQELLYRESQTIIEEFQKRSGEIQVRLVTETHQQELTRLARRVEQSHIFFEDEIQTVVKTLNIVSRTRNEADRVEIERITRKIEQKERLTVDEAAFTQSLLNDITRMRDTADQAEYARLVARLRATETLSAQEIEVIRRTLGTIAALRQDASSADLLRVSELVGTQPLSETDLNQLNLPELAGAQRRGRITQSFDVVNQIKENPAQGLDFMAVDAGSAGAGIDELIGKTTTLADTLGLTADEAGRVGERIASDLAGGLRQALFEGQNFGSAMKSVMKGLIADLMQAVVRAILLKTVFAALGMGGTASFGQLVKQGMGFMHSGGRVPEDIQMKRFHSGGQVSALDFPTIPLQLSGLQRGEVPLIAKEGEIILNAMQQRNVAGAMAGKKEVHYHDQRTIEIGTVFGDEKDRLRRWVRDDLSPVLDEK